ncbi:MAG: hypothetical protein AAGE99_04545 [Chlamydiota bacterium]
MSRGELSRSIEGKNGFKVRYSPLFAKDSSASYPFQFLFVKLLRCDIETENRSKMKRIVSRKENF